MSRYSDWKTQQTFLSFLIPSWLEVLTYSLLAFFALCVMNFQRFWRLLTEGATIDPESLSTAARTSLTQFDKFQQSSITGDIFVLLIWAAIGSFAYMVVWLTQNSLSTAKQELDKGLVNGAMVKQNYMNAVVAHFAFFIALTIVTITSLVITAGVIIPTLNSAFFGAMSNFAQFEWQKLLTIVICVICLAFVFYVLRLLLLIYVRFWRTYMRAQ